MIEEESMLAHGRVERLFAGVAEGRMSDIVNQSERFDQIAVRARAALRSCARFA